MAERPRDTKADDVDGTHAPTRSGRRFSTLIEKTTPMPAHPSAAPLAGDILYGADAIAAFMFGDTRHRRRVYNLVERHKLPVFRIGVNICARKSVLLAFISEQERHH